MVRGPGLEQTILLQAAGRKGEYLVIIFRQLPNPRKGRGLFHVKDFPSSLPDVYRGSFVEDHELSTVRMRRRSSRKEIGA